MIRSIAKASLATAALLGLFAVYQGAMAAELVQLEGKVSVNRGDGFEPAKQGMVLKPGDQVLVGKESSASLIYAEPGCVFDIAEASVVTVSDVGPCIPGQTTALGESALVVPAATDGGTDLTPFYVMGGGAIIGTTAFVISEANNGNGNGSRQPPPAPGFPGPGCNAVSCP